MPVFDFETLDMQPTCSKLPVAQRHAEQQRTSIGTLAVSRSSTQVPSGGIQKRRKTDSSTSVSAEEQLVKFAKEEHDLKMTQLREFHKAQMEIIKIKKTTATLKKDMTIRQSCNGTEYGNGTEFDNYTLQQL